MILIVGLTPGTWLRSAPPKPNFSQRLTMAPLALPEANLKPVEAVGQAADLKTPELAGLWELKSANSAFGSYSALLLTGNGQFLAASDGGGVLRFPQPGKKGPVKIGWLGGRKLVRKNLADIESLTRDPESGQIWAGYEGANSVERLSRKLESEGVVRPEMMRGWSGNSGPEAMVRLKDGRFIIVSEGARDWYGRDHRALIFSGDPVAGAKSTRFTFLSETGFSPVDMAQLPDGRVLILLRDFTFGLPPRFSVKLAVADPSEIKAGENWEAQVIANIDDPALADNYEGLAIEELDNGMVNLWLISDDNNVSFQRLLLLKLRWDPRVSQGRIMPQ